MSPNGGRPALRRPWLPAAVLAALALGAWAVSPRFADDGVSRYRGQARAAAEEALLATHLLLDHPAEKGLIQQLRVEEVEPLPNASRAGPGAQTCCGPVRVKAYSFFWIPYGVVTVRGRDAAWEWRIGEQR